MALLSRKVDYALLVLSYLHHRAAGGCAREIAERFGLKKAFAANVLKVLCQRGLVRSERGARGGYLLARPAGQIRLSELLDLLGEPFHLADCRQADAEGGGCGLNAVCPVREAILEVDRRIGDVLATVTLADLFRTPPAQAPQPDGRFGLEMVAAHEAGR